MLAKEGHELETQADQPMTSKRRATLFAIVKDWGEKAQIHYSRSELLEAVRHVCGVESLKTVTNAQADAAIAKLRGQGIGRPTPQRTNNRTARGAIRPRGPGQVAAIKALVTGLVRLGRDPQLLRTWIYDNYEIDDVEADTYDTRDASHLIQALKGWTRKAEELLARERKGAACDV